MKKAFILEDDEIQNKILEMKLNQDGFTVTSCSNYNSAISEIKNGDFSVYFVDLILGNEKNGLDFISEIRKKSNSLIIITSNFELKNDLHKETSMLLGFGNYGLDPIKEVENIVFYTKPLNFDRILIKLSEL